MESRNFSSVNNICKEKKSIIWVKKNINGEVEKHNNFLGNGFTIFFKHLNK